MQLAVSENVVLRRNKTGPFFDMKHTHYHEVYEVYYLHAGACRFFINGAIYNISKGDLVFIEPGSIHRTTYGADKKQERMFIHIPNTYMVEIHAFYSEAEIKKMLMHPVLTVPQHKRSYIEALLQKLEEEYTNPDTYSKLLIKNYVLELIVLSMRMHETKSTNQLVGISEEDERIQQAAQYMLLHYEEEMTLEQVAAYINLSPSYFSKQFKTATGFGFKEYLTSIRLKKAIQLLEETKLPITEIAYACGFNDSNYFGDVFKKIKGISPTKYRNRKK